MKTSYFWGVDSSQVTTVIMLSPTARGEQYSISSYTPSGEKYKELTLVVSDSTGASLELQNILREILPESGLRHASFKVDYPDSGYVTSRLNCTNNSTIAGELRQVSTSQPAFYPKTFSRGVRSYLVLVNVSEQPIEAIVRVVAQNRAPEKNYEIAANATLLINLEVDFDEIADMSFKQRVPAYVRARCKLENAMCVGFFEQILDDNISVFSIVN
ncbi:MAG: hypothetical protein SGJ02_11135 [bacterium]|nr:hypothetical protein [bacterium]